MGLSVTRRADSRGKERRNDRDEEVRGARSAWLASDYRDVHTMRLQLTDQS